MEKSTNALFPEQVAKPSDDVSVIFHKSCFVPNTVKAVPAIAPTATIPKM